MIFVLNNFEYLIFLHWNQTQNEVYFDELERLIVTKTRNQIDQHENWFSTYLSLKELKKEAIKKWKENKKVLINFICLIIFLNET